MYAPLCVSNACRNAAASLAQHESLAFEHSVAFAFSQQGASAFA
jgi:hypothetical protein